MGHPGDRRISLTSTYDEEVAANALLLAAGGPRKDEVKNTMLKSNEAITSKHIIEYSIAPLLTEKKVESSSSFPNIRYASPPNRNIHLPPNYVSPNSSTDERNGNEQDKKTSIIKSNNVNSGKDFSKEKLQQELTVKAWQQASEEVNDICLPVDDISLHFPSHLHLALSSARIRNSLSSTKNSGAVVEWLPHGKSWRVLRWDAFAKDIVPFYFPYLCNEDSKMRKGNKSYEDNHDCKRINMFLEKMKEWGFTEVREASPDLGSYRHDSFIRENPKLCLKMTTARKPPVSSSSETENIQQQKSLNCVIKTKPVLSLDSNSFHPGQSEGKYSSPAYGSTILSRLHPLSDDTSIHPCAPKHDIKSNDDFVLENLRRVVTSSSTDLIGTRNKKGCDGGKRKHCEIIDSSSVYDLTVQQKTDHSFPPYFYNQVNHQGKKLSSSTHAQPFSMVKSTTKEDSRQTLYNKYDMPYSNVEHQGRVFYKTSHPSSIRSGRGGARTTSKKSYNVEDYEEVSNRAITPLNTFSVSSRGKGNHKCKSVPKHRINSKIDLQTIKGRGSPHMNGNTIVALKQTRRPQIDSKTNLQKVECEESSHLNGNTNTAFEKTWKHRYVLN